nr:Rpn family recombination-promoting nuclease/putative transposase [Desulfoscipio gibsoniae]
MFYWAGLYYGQLASGQNFIYLRKTITINILGFNWFEDTGKYHHTFHIREDQTGELLNDDLEIHFLELGKITKLKRKPQNAFPNSRLALPFHIQVTANLFNIIPGKRIPH